VQKVKGINFLKLFTGIFTASSKVCEKEALILLSCLIEPRKFWLVDLGSSFGTYIRLKGDMMYPLERGQTYLVGLDTIFNIVDVRSIILPVSFSLF